MPSVIAPLVDLANIIFTVTRDIRSKPWEDFGEYVNEVVRRVGSTVDIGQSPPNEALASNTTTLKITLDKILRKVSKMRDRRLIYRFIGYITDEYCIADLRLELDESLHLFQVSIIVSMREDIGEVLSRVKQINHGSKPNGAGTTRISWYSDSTSPVAPGPTEPPLCAFDRILPPPAFPNLDLISLGRCSGLGFNSTRPYPRVFFSEPTNLEEWMNYVRQGTKTRRLLVQEHPEYRFELARSLHYLSALLAEAKQLEDAVLACQEATNLYRSLLETGEPARLPGQVATGAEDGPLIEIKVSELFEQTIASVEKGPASGINVII